jgi:DNA invertase Pin-like site-specific DNA recombinase
LNDDARPAGSVSSFSPAPRHDEFGVTWFLIDDLSRLSRNTIESLRHGELAEATGVRVVGASDGYDSANPQSSLLLPVLGSMNEAFITQLRSKVKRGMDDAFRRGDNISNPAWATGSLT